MLQNKVGGGKPKMRWFFGEFGWPEAKMLGRGPQTDEERAKLVDMVQEYKTNKYMELIGWVAGGWRW